ncbi:MAG: purine-nucleoside phosphorylase [Salibacteraceae bacterium]
MESLFDKIQTSKTYLINHGVKNAEIAIILGTGLGKLIEEFEILQRIPYSDIPNFPEATVEHHTGELIYGNFQSKKVLAMKGRFHFYEGHSFEHIGFSIWLFKSLGIKAMLLSGAAGTINMHWSKGDLMMLTDHINLLPGNPLIGTNDDRLGPRFPDMSEPYDYQINEEIERAAEKTGVLLRKGVYVSAQGPMLETAAEYRFLRTIGGDAVGMSTVPEVIVANHACLPCSAVIVLTDECNPDDLKPINIPQIIEVAGKAEAKLTILFKELIKHL